MSGEVNERGKAKWERKKKRRRWGRRRRMKRRRWKRERRGRRMRKGRKKIERRKQDDEDISIRQDKKELGRGRRQKEREEGKMCPSFKHIHS